MTGSVLDSLVPREDFPVLRRQIDGREVIYLDSAATSLTPLSVIQAESYYYHNVRANIHRGKHMLSEEASTTYEAVRARVARYLNARSDEVVFTLNTTHGMSILANGLRREGLVSLVPADAHHSGMLPWRQVGATHVYRVDETGRVDFEDLERHLSIDRPDVLVVNGCSNVTGRLQPVRKMADLGHAVGAKVVADLAQYAPHRPVDLPGLGLDCGVLSLHKMLGPTGLGLLFGKADFLEAIVPTSLGGGTVDWVDEMAHVVRRLPHRLEAGTPNIGGVYGAGAAIDYLDSLDNEDASRWESELTRLLYKEIANRDYLHAVGGTDHRERTCIASLRIDEVARLEDLVRVLSDAYGVMCRGGHLCSQPFVSAQAPRGVLRISAYFYNSSEDLLRVFRALDQAVPLLKR